MVGMGVYVPEITFIVKDTGLSFPEG